MLDLNENIEDILIELLKIQSFTNSEEKISNKIFKTLLNFNIQPLYNKDFNLIYFYSSEDASFTTKIRQNNTIALIGHIDTVSPFLEVKREDKIIYGRGAVDMKAGISVMLKLIYELKQNKLKTKYNIHFVFYTKEEGPLPNGLSQILDTKILQDIDEAIVLEPTSKNVFTGCLGTASYQIEIQGKASHSANPHNGKNAIYESVPLINKIKEYNNTLETNTYKNVYPTINITQINTQNFKNIIPELAVITVNFRFTPELKITKNNAINYLKKEILKNNNYNINLIDFAPSIDNKESKLFNTNGKMFQAWADIAQLHQHNIFGTLFGPGDLELAHTQNEHISITSLQDYYKQLTGSLL